MTERIRVTTDPEYYEEHAESVELFVIALAAIAVRLVLKDKNS